MLSTGFKDELLIVYTLLELPVADLFDFFNTIKEDSDISAEAAP